MSQWRDELNQLLQAHKSDQYDDLARWTALITKACDKALKELDLKDHVSNPVMYKDRLEYHLDDYNLIFSFNSANLLTLRIEFRGVLNSPSVYVEDIDRLELAKALEKLDRRIMLKSSMGTQLMDKIHVVHVETIPDKLEALTLYVSDTYHTAIHLCACGCGYEIVTPLSGRMKWSLIESEQGVTLSPSIGNFSLPCVSHYWIRNGRIKWVNNT
jgi:hypothetical protein